MASFHRDALTLSAEVFAVVGVADVVLRQLIALTNLATAAANASRTAREMRVRLQSLASAILAVRSWAESYAASDFASQDNQRISATVTETLLQCSTRLGAIFKNLHDIGSGASGTLARFWTGLRFARDEQALHQAMTDLSSYTSALQLAMQSRQGTDLAIIRRQQTLHAQSTAENHNALKTGVDAVLQTTSAFAQATESNHAATLARIDDLQTSHVAASSQLMTANTNTIKAGFLDIRQSHAVASEKLIAATQASLKACTEKLTATLQLTHLNEDEVLVEGDNLSAGLHALQYLNKHLSHSLESLAESEDGLVLPTSLTASLTGEIDKMIRYSQRCNRAGTDALLAKSNYQLPQRIHTVPIRTYSQAKHEDGFVAIESAEGKDPLGRRVQHIRFMAISLKPTGQGSAILGLISLIDPATHQQIRRQLRVMNIIPRDSPVFSLVESDDVGGIKKLLAEGKASVLDYTDNGLGLFWHASIYLSWATMAFLLDIGADANQCRLTGQILEASIVEPLAVGAITSHFDGTLSMSVSESVSTFKQCRDFLCLSNNKVSEINTVSLFLYHVDSHLILNTPENSVPVDPYFSLFWDSGLGRKTIMGLLQLPKPHLYSQVAAVTAWVRSGALLQDPLISNADGQTSIHALLLVFVQGDCFQERLGLLIEATTSDWERLCRAVYYADRFRFASRMPVPLDRTTIKRLLLMLLKAGADPLQQDKKGVSAWGYVQTAKEADREAYGRVLEPFILRRKGPSIPGPFIPMKRPFM